MTIEARPEAGGDPGPEPGRDFPASKPPPEGKPNAYTPVGRLAQTLDEYRAPEDVRNVITRRVGGAIGNQGITHEQLERDIKKSLHPTTGVPLWPDVVGRLLKRVRGLYGK